MPSFKFMNAHFLDPRLSHDVLSRRLLASQQNWIRRRATPMMTRDLRKIGISGLGLQPSQRNTNTRRAQLRQAGEAL